MVLELNLLQKFCEPIWKYVFLAKMFSPDEIIEYKTAFIIIHDDKFNYL